MRQHPRPVGDQFGAGPADGPTGTCVFVPDCMSLGQQFGQKMLGGHTTCHTIYTIESPEQVHRGGPTGAQVGGDLADSGAARPCFEADDHAERGSTADGRSAADTQRADRLPHLLDGVAVAIGDLAGEKSLIE